MTEQNRIIQAYEQFTEKTRSLLKDSGEKSAEALDRAMEQARESQEKAGDLTREESERFKRFLQRDLEQTARDFQSAGEKASDTLSPAAMKSSVYGLISDISGQAKGLFEKLNDWAESEVTFKTGEISGPAKLKCKSCGEQVKMTETGHIPPCPGCHQSEFKRAA